MNERIRIIREQLKLSRAAFGKKIGVSGDVINNLERGRVEIKESIIKLICNEFNVHEEYLRYDKLPIFIETPSGTMEQLKKEFNLDEFSYNLVYEYLKLEPDQRDVVRNFFYSVVKEDETAVTSDNISSNACTIAEAEEAYIKSRSRTAKKTGQYVLNTTAENAAFEDNVVNQ